MGILEPGSTDGPKVLGLEQEIVTGWEKVWEIEHLSGVK